METVKPAPLFLRRERQALLPEPWSDFLRTLAQREGFRGVAAKRLLTLGFPQRGDEDFRLTREADWKEMLQRVPALPDLLPETPTAGPSGQAADLAAWIGEETDPLALVAWASAPHAAAGDLSRLSDGSGRLDLPRTPPPEGDRLQALWTGHVPAKTTARIRLSALPSRLANGTVYVSVADDASLDLLLPDVSGVDGIRFLHVGLRLGSRARLRLWAPGRGSAFDRLGVRVHLDGPGADADLRFASGPSGKGQAHRHVQVRHAAPDARSRQTFKSVADGQSRVTVDGTIVVDRAAQRTDAGQLLRGLILGNDARIESKPRLRIHADDVKCSHGATVGRLDEEQAFYLRSRGLSEEEARRLLVAAFFAELAEGCPFPDAVAALASGKATWAAPEDHP